LIRIQTVYMSNTINFAIDLGTTNSLIARSLNGVPEIFRNPAGMKQTLPSVVGFRKDRILIGDKAREYTEKDPQNVIGGFKRKMGTGESFFVPAIQDFKNPIQLSSMILSELKNFIYTNESPEHIVITIPASFDTIQSNATKKAGYEAGFKEVVLLQEPIAASLAFANKENDQNITGQWLVYDLGGGTFDVALIRITEDEMKAIDHEGDNFLGGLDFDSLIVTELVVPLLEKKFNLVNLADTMLSGTGKYNSLYYQLLYKAEELKIQLSSRESADIEFEFSVGEPAETHEIFLSISRKDFESVIVDKILYSIDFIKKLLARNNLSSNEIKEVILVGGSTYIPLVRNLIKEILHVNINCSVDPTIAVVVGAAHYAAGKTKYLNPSASATIQSSLTDKNSPATLISVKTAYQKHSREQEEYFTAAISDAPAGCMYRIIREDGGYDSGLKTVSERISEMLHLLPNTVNSFKITFYSDKQQPLIASENTITISQGKFSIDGQPLPADICIEVDDTDNNNTYLEVIFEKNTLLPIKKTITKTLSRSIRKGSDDQLIINILEGSRYATPQTNLPIGLISISGSKVTRDLVKGSDVDLTFEISESRDITIKAYISISEQEFREVFNPSVRTVNIARLREEIDYLIRIGKRSLDDMVRNEQFEKSAMIQSSIQELESLLKKLKKMTDDDITDIKYQADELKRKHAHAINDAGNLQRSIEMKEAYFLAKIDCQHYLDQSNNSLLKQQFEKITESENEWLTFDNPSFIKRKITELSNLSWEIRRKDIAFVTHLYLYYSMKADDEYSDLKKIKILRKRGDEALERKNTDEILSIVYQMYELLIDKNNDEMLKGTGLSG
jgi:molecular chaperone DnaK